MRREWTIGLTVTLLGLWWVGIKTASAVESRALVGVTTTERYEVSLYAWSPQHVIDPEKGHHAPAPGTTHHLDLTVYDKGRRLFVPYLTVTVTAFERPAMRKAFTVTLEPMIGEWLHYGANIALLHPGWYVFQVDISPPDIARYRHMADVWSKPARVLFYFEYQ